MTGGVNYKPFLEELVPRYLQLQPLLFDTHSLAGS